MLNYKEYNFPHPPHTQQIGPEYEKNMTKNEKSDSPYGNFLTGEKNEEEKKSKKTETQDRHDYISQKISDMDENTKDWLNEMNKFSDQLLKDDLYFMGEEKTRKNDQNKIISKSNIEKNQNTNNNDTKQNDNNIDNRKLITEIETSDEFQNLELDDEFLSNCDDKSKELINGILRKQKESNLKTDFPEFEQECDSTFTNTSTVALISSPKNHEDLLGIHICPSENSNTNNPSQIESDCTLIENFTPETSNVLDPEGGESPIAISNIKKLVSTLIYQNHELRRTQNEALQRETELKTELTQHQKLIEHKLNDIGEKLEALCDGSSAIQSPVQHQATNHNKKSNISRKSRKSNQSKRSNNKKANKRKIPTVNASLSLPNSRGSPRLAFGSSQISPNSFRRKKSSSLNSGRRAVNSRRNKRRQDDYYPQHSFRFKQNVFNSEELVTINLCELDKF